MYNIFTRLAIYAALGLLLEALGHTWSTWGFWAMLALFVCLDKIAAWEGEQSGTAHGVRHYINLTEEQQAEVRKLIRKWEER